MRINSNTQPVLVEFKESCKHGWRPTWRPRERRDRNIGPWRSWIIWWKTRGFPGTGFYFRCREQRPGTPRGYAHSTLPSNWSEPPLSLVIIKVIWLQSLSDSLVTSMMRDLWWGRSARVDWNLAIWRMNLPAPLGDGLFCFISEKMLHNLINRESECSKIYLWARPSLSYDYSLIIQDLSATSCHWEQGRVLWFWGRGSNDRMASTWSADLGASSHCTRDIQAES